jgi:hypothetical protein
MNNWLNPYIRASAAATFLELIKRNDREPILTRVAPASRRHQIEQLLNLF